MKNGGHVIVPSEKYAGCSHAMLLLPEYESQDLRTSAIQALHHLRSVKLDERVGIDEFSEQRKDWEFAKLDGIPEWEMVNASGEPVTKMAAYLLTEGVTA